VIDDVSEVTLPAWPGQGRSSALGYSSGLLAQFGSSVLGCSSALFVSSAVFYLYSCILCCISVVDLLYTLVMMSICIKSHPPKGLVGRPLLFPMDLGGRSPRSSWTQFWGVTNWYQSTGLRHSTESSP
jgi:hypothetical protein